MKISKHLLVTIALCLFSSVAKASDKPIYGSYELTTCFEKDTCETTYTASLVWFTYADGERDPLLVDYSRETIWGSPKTTTLMEVSAVNADIAQTKKGPIVRAEICPHFQARIPMKKYRCNVLYQEPLAAWQAKYKH